jgi:hypothetical protein
VQNQIFAEGVQTKTAKLTQLYRKNTRPMLVHHVFFWMPANATPTDKMTLRAGLELLKGIDLIKEVHIGEPAATRRPVIDSSYTFSLLRAYKSFHQSATSAKLSSEIRLFYRACKRFHQSATSAKLSSVLRLFWCTMRFRT